MSEDDTSEIDTLLTKLKGWWRRDRDHSASWRTEAQEDYAFVAGDQWDPKDVDALREQKRPVITFNRADPLIRSVAGEQINNAQEVRYLQREQGDAKANELLTNAASWFRDQCDADDEESDAFWDASICGVGVTDTRLDFDNDPTEPVPVTERIDPLEIYVDCDARKRNYADARRIWRIRDMPRETAANLFPDASPTDLDASWARNGSSQRDDDRDDYTTSISATSPNEDEASDEDTITIVQVQWYETKAFIKTIDPSTQAPIELPADEFKRLEPRLKALGIPSVRLDRRVYKQAFLGRTILKQTDLACPHFTFNFITAFRDRNRGIFYGLLRAMKDPQRWANKWLAQTLHIMNATAKGGVMAESSAFDDRAAFERSYAKMDQVTWVPDGTLTNKRIQEKPVTSFPAGFFQMMEFSISSVRDVSGINLEMLGMREANQPASLEAQRRQAGITILAQLFRSMRRYHRSQGQVMLYYIQNYLSDGRLIKIIGEQGAQYVPLMKQADAKYDIVVDEGPSSPNQKERIWALVGERFWALPPDMQAIMLKYSPFPETVVEELQAAQKAAQEGPQAQAQQQMLQLNAMLTQAKTTLAEAQAALAQAKAQETAASIGQPPNGAPDNASQQAMIQMAQLQQNAQSAAEKSRLKLVEITQKSALGQQQIAAEAQTAQQKTAAELQAAREKAAVDYQTNLDWQHNDLRKAAITNIGRQSKPSPNKAP